MHITSEYPAALTRKIDVRGGGNNAPEWVATIAPELVATIIPEWVATIVQNPQLRKKESRHGWSRNISDAVKEACNWECVLCGDNSGKAALQAGHLDEDSANNAVPNLCPQCGTCNAAIQNSRYARVSLPRHLMPDVLVPRARRLFANDKFLASYLCLRQSAHLACKRNADISRQFDCIVESLGAIRPVNGGEGGNKCQPQLRRLLRKGTYLRYSLLELHKIFSMLGPRDFAWQRAECLSQVGLTLIDYALFSDGSNCLISSYLLKKQLVSKGACYSRSRENDDQELARERRRLAWALSGSSLHSKLWKESYESLKDDLRFFASHGNFRQVGTNLDVLAAIQAQRSGSGDNRIVDFVEQGLETKDKIENNWVLSSLYSHLGAKYAVEFSKSRHKSVYKKAQGFLSQTTQLLNESGIVPEPARGEQTSADCAYSLIGETPAIPLITIRGEFPLSAQELYEFLKAVLGDLAISQKEAI